MIGGTNRCVTANRCSGCFLQWVDLTDHMLQQSERRRRSSIPGWMEDNLKEKLHTAIKHSANATASQTESNFLSF